MSTNLKKIDELYKSTPESVLTIAQLDGNGGYVRDQENKVVRLVRAPLPDGFGMSVGSSFTDPQNIDLAAQAQSSGNRLFQAAASVASFAATATGRSTKALVNSNVFYSGPEPTEISFEISFNAYYSAYDEVIVPTQQLMKMSVGQEETFGDTNFGLIKSAGICQLKFGKTFVIPRAYVSSVGVKFSNVLDNHGHPISADCSVTIKVVRNPTQREVDGYFGASAR